MTSLRDLAADLQLATALADLADAITLPAFRSPELHIALKTDHTEVTDADRRTERALRDRLAAARPADTILGEEYGGAGTDGWQWILDPIDGTANFVRGIPVWATLIGLTQNGIPQLGVVSAPALNRRWSGVVGTGATAVWNGQSRPIHVSAQSNLASATVSIGSMEYWRDDRRAPAALQLLAQSARDRSLGDFWPYVLVAEGAMDVACEPGLKPYDMAAPCAVVTAAGGTFTDLTGHSTIWGGSALATNSHLHSKVAKVFKEKR